MDTAQTIAGGGEPYWQDTFDHPSLGKLTFKVERTLKVADWLTHATRQEQLAPGTPSILAAAVAGMQTFVQCPVVREERDVDPGNSDHVIIRVIRYDPLEDERMEFPMLVWVRFMDWRARTLSDETKDDVKNSSGATTGATSAEPSPEPTASLPTTPA